MKSLGASLNAISVAWSCLAQISQLHYAHNTLCVRPDPHRTGRSLRPAPSLNKVMANPTELASGPAQG